MVDAPEWSHVESLPPGGRISPYIHWTEAWSLKPPPVSEDDLLVTQTPWLKSAVRRALDGAAAPWARLLGEVLPVHALPKAPVKTTAAGAMPGTDGKGRNAADRIVIGVIDDATAFAHERFRRPSGGSRVSYLWIHDAPHKSGVAGPPFGAELDRGAIDALIDAHGRRGATLDEDAVYRDAGALDMSLGTPQTLARRAGHGTAVADLAAGFSDERRQGDDTAIPQSEPMEIAPDDFDLALVSLPERLIMDTSGTFAEIFVILGMIRLIDHVEAQAGTVGDCPPLVINISLGLTAGPRDGSSLLDRFIAEIEAARPRDRAPIRVVFPAGNFRQAQVHAVLDGPLDRGAPPLFWHLPPDDPTPSFLEIWSLTLSRRPEKLPYDLALHQDPKLSEPSLGAEPLDGVYELRRGPALMARCYTQWIPSGRGGAGRVRTTLAMPPTTPRESSAASVAPGSWRLILAPFGEAAASGWPLDLVVQRDDMIPGYRGGGRQSYLLDPRYCRYDASGRIETEDRRGKDGSLPHVRRAGTINAYATAPEIVVVGGCFADTFELVDYSGEGGTKGRGLRRVDVSAPASVRRLGGVIRAAGSRSGSHVGVGGTSVAAPVMSRELAKAMRPPRDRPKLSGVALLHRDLRDGDPPPVLSVAETLNTETRSKGSSGGTFTAS